MPDQVNDESLRVLRSVFYDLFDSVIYARRASDASKDLEGLRAGENDRKKRVDQLQSDLVGLINVYSQEEKSAFFQGIRETLMKFISATLDDFKKKIAPSNSDQITAKEEEVKAYRAKSVRAIEVFLSRNYIPVNDSEVSLKFQNGGYECRYRANCPKDLEYEFLLDTSEVEFLRSRLFPSSFQKGIRVPVRLGKSWMSKDPVPDFERLDEYYISSSNLSSGDLFIKLTHDEAGSEIRIHQTNADVSSFLEVEYQDSLGKVSVTSEPALNGNLERDGILTICRQMRNSLEMLKEKKLRISSLVLRETNVLETQNYSSLITTIVEILLPSIKDAFAAVISGSLKPSDQQIISKDQILDRLKFVPDIAPAITAMFGFQGLLDGMGIN
jgi:hypothetical protein